MTESDIEVVEQDGATIAVLGTEYDNLDTDQLTAASAQLLKLAKDADPPNLVIDLSRTRYFASAFLGVLFRVWNRLKQRGGSMAMCGASDMCAEVLKVTNVEKLWGIYEERADAVSAVSK